MTDTTRSSGAGPAGKPGANPDVSALNDASLGADPLAQARLAAVIFAARYHGVEMNPESLRLRPDEPAPSPPVLVEWLREAGLWVRGVPMNFRQLMKIDDPAPVVLLLDDGGAALVVGRDRERGLLLLRDPRGDGSTQVVAVDELGLKRVWGGATLLIRARRGGQEGEPVFNLGLIARLVWADKRIMRDIAISSITITILSLVPIFVVMRVIGTVLEYHGTATLDLVILLLIVAIGFEMALSWGRKLMEVILAAKLDSRLNLMIFDRLLSLPIEFFERQQAGELAYKVNQVNQVRDFLTGKLMNTFIDLFMLCILLPLIFFMNATLAWTVLIAAALIAAVIAAFLRPLAVMTGRTIAAESGKGSVLVESIYGIKTVKALALELTRATDWDRRVAEVAELHVEAGRLANWPATLAMPLQRYCTYGAITLGAYIALHTNNPVDAGSLTGFMMLGGRVAGPLVSLAGLMEDVQKAQAAIGQVGYVLNRPNEKHALTHGLRPRFEGEIEFDDVTFKYEGAKAPALDKMSFKIPAGTMLGLVGPLGLGQVHHHPPAAGHQPRLSGRHQDRRQRHARDQPAPHPQKFRHGAAGQLPVPRHGAGEHHRRPAGPVVRGCGTRRAPRRGGRVHRAHAQRLRHLHPGRLAQPFRRAETAPGHRPRPDLRPESADHGRGDLRPRPGERGAGERQHPAHRQGAHDGDRLAPPLLAARLRPDHGARPRPHHRYRHASRAGGALRHLPSSVVPAEPPPRA